MGERYKAARVRETRFIMSFDVPRLNKRLFLLLGLFIVLNFLDAFTTLLAIRAGPAFMELNPIAAGLFGLNFPGFSLALTLKYLPVVPLSYVTFLKNSESHPVAFRIVKVSAFVALVAADIFLLIVVGSNVRTLLAYYY